MLSVHPYSQHFLEHMARTQQAYTERRLEDYLAGFSERYSSVVLGTEWGEDKAGLRSKMLSDFERFELLSMDFEVLHHWYAGETGFAQLAYLTRLKVRASGKVLLDRRQNILVGEHLGEGRWSLICKIVLKAENVYE
ncbi:hypothetical protein IT575_10665 [bacterium]|nr:hypothetical protein [bacterium]